MLKLGKDDTERACGLLRRICNSANRVYGKGFHIPKTIEQSDLDWLKGLGLAPNQRRKLTHAQAASKLVQAKTTTSLERGAQAFLLSLGTSAVPHGIWLEAALLAQTLPQHRFKNPHHHDGPCLICGMPREEVIDVSEQFLGFHTQGGGIPGDVVWALVGLETLPIEMAARGVVEGRKRLLAVLRRLDDLPARAGPSKAVAAVRELKLFEHDPGGWHARAVVETLGFAGLLDAPPRRGLLSGYASFSARDERPTMRTEFDAPLGFWRGANGVNWQSAEVLFGLTANARLSAPSPKRTERASRDKSLPKKAAALPKKTARKSGLKRRPAEAGDVWAIRLREDAYVLVYVWETQDTRRVSARVEYLDWFGPTPPEAAQLPSGIRGRGKKRWQMWATALEKTTGTLLLAEGAVPPATSRPVPTRIPNGAAKELSHLADWCFDELDVL